MGLFSKNETRWSATCDEVSTDVDYALDLIEETVNVLKRLQGACSTLKRHDNQDPAVLENMADMLKQAAAVELGELTRSAQSVNMSAAHMSNIIHSFV